MKYIIYIFCFIALQLNAQDLILTINTVNESCTLGSATASVTGGTAPYNYFWSNGDDAETAKNLIRGDYNLRVTDAISRSASANFTIEYEECEPVAENYFSPNNDGINDTWSIIHIEKYPEFSLTVYNRWGQQVHHQLNNYNPWNGSTLGLLPLPDGTYYYILYYNKLDRKKFSKGSVSIIR